MSDLYNRCTPVAQAEFRANTDKRNMIGVAKVPGMTRCIQCEKRRTTGTGRETKLGFVCHGCAK